MLHGTVPTPGRGPRTGAPAGQHGFFSRPCQQSPELQLCHMARAPRAVPGLGPSGEEHCVHVLPLAKSLTARICGLCRWMAHSPPVPKTGPRNMSTPSLCHSWNAEPRSTDKQPGHLPASCPTQADYGIKTGSIPWPL